MAGARAPGRRSPREVAAAGAAPGPAAPRAAIDPAVALLLVGLCAIWGGGQVAIKVGNQGITPLWHAAMRSAGAALLLWLWARGRGVRLLARDGTWGYGLLIGGLFALEFVCIYWGFVFTTAARGVLFVYAAPFVVALGAHWALPGERLSRTKLLGLGAAFAGLALAFTDALRLPTRRQLGGDLLELAGAVFWGLTTLIIKARGRAVGPHRTLFYQLAGSAVLLAGLAAATGERGIVQLTGPVVLAVLYQTVLIAFASYLAWFWLLTRYPASHMHAYTFWTPLFGLLGGWLLLDEPVTPRLALAMGAVLLGIHLVNRAPAGAPGRPGSASGP
jgi:drug/metabolite transporter (DMT)-like permease